MINMCRYIPSNAHGNGACGDLGEAGSEDDGGGNTSTGEAGGKGEGDSEAVGDAEDDVPDHLPGHEVVLLVHL